MSVGGFVLISFSFFFIFFQGVKKPYNPILGEVFQCSWDWGANGKTMYVAEQVSPPFCRCLSLLGIMPSSMNAHPLYLSLFFVLSLFPLRLFSPSVPLAVLLSISILPFYLSLALYYIVSLSHARTRARSHTHRRTRSHTHKYTCVQAHI